MPDGGGAKESKSRDSQFADVSCGCRVGAYLCALLLSSPHDRAAAFCGKCFAMEVS